MVWVRGTVSLRRRERERERGEEVERRHSRVKKVLHTHSRTHQWGEESVIVSEVFSFQRLMHTRVVLGVGKLERCLQFRGVLIEGFHLL